MKEKFQIGELVIVKDDPDVSPFCGEIARVSILNVPCMDGIGMEVISDHLGRFKGTYEQFERLPDKEGMH